MNKKVLILGSSGLLGKTLVDDLLKGDYQIGVLARNPLDYKEACVSSYPINILDIEPLEEVIQKYDIIINCTGQITNPSNNCLLLNTQGIKNIVDLVNKYNKRLIHISSVAVYGTAEYIDEDSDLNPETTYGSMKCFSEFLIKTTLKDYVILRSSNLYGKNQEKGIINYLTKSYLSNNQELYFNNDGTLKRYYLLIDDFSQVISEFIEKEISGVFNVAGNDCFTIKELIHMFEEILDYTFDVNYQRVKPNENIDVIDICKTRNVVKTSLKPKMRNYIESLKDETI